MTVKIIQGDCRQVLKTLPDCSVNCCVTSPPYFGLRDYGTAKWEGGNPECDHFMPPLGGTAKSTLSLSVDENGFTTSKTQPNKVQYKDICRKCGAKRIDSQIGLEQTPNEYVNQLVGVFREVKRVLRDDGTLWLNLGDSYCGYKGDNYCKNPEASHLQSKNHIPVANKQGTPQSSGLKPKDLIGIPWLVAFALRADGWYLRQDIIWYKPNPMPESVTDRCTKSHEYIFLLSKSQKYYYDQDAIMESAIYGEQHANKTTSWGPNGKMAKNDIGKSNRDKYLFKGENHTCHKRKNDGTNHGGNGTGFQEHSGYNQLDNPYVRNKRSVWTVTTKPYKESHFATFPPDLIRPCILAGCPVGGTVLDPFGGSGTVGEVSEMEGRNSILIELNPKYIKLINNRTAQRGLFCGEEKSK